MGITAPSSFTKTVLKSLYKENHKPSNDVDQIQRERSRSPIRERSRSPVSADRAANPTGPAYNITMAPTSSPVEGAGFGECLATLNSTMTAFTETMKRLNNATTGPTPSVHGPSTRPPATLSDIYQNRTTPIDGMYNQPNSYLDNLRHMAANTPNGIPSSLLSTVDVVSDSLRTLITNGRDVNLASLLIPNFEIKNETNGDPRLKRRLSIEQFRIAFGKYRRIMVQKFPHRRQELEDYENDISKIHAFYGERFYDYHLAFSSKAAEAVKMEVEIGWSKRDTEQFQLILGGTKARQCLNCFSTLHDTDFCPSANDSNQRGRQLPGNNQRSLVQRPITTTRDNHTDLHGRKVIFHQGQEICNNFNSSQGCARRNCTRFHACASCTNPGHTKLSCPKKIMNRSNPSFNAKKD